jgi:asparagine synthase (glutamine-hydrolysing)
MVAGDGGDEIFGGNERYLKDKIFQYYFSSPGVVKKLGRGMESALSAMDSRWPNKVKNFVRRGSLPNPDRFYTDDSFASEYFDTLLTADFREQVKPDDSLDVQRSVYARCSAADELHRLMYLDLKMTIAANDVVKVVRTTRLAGVGVAFPFLEQSLVDFTGRLPARHKLRGSNKRYLFKKAMATVLPEAIQKKKKQGFGMPLSVWMQRGGLFQDLVVDTLNSQAARERGWFEHAAIGNLLDRHKRGAWDYSAELYILTMLELWQQREAGARDAYGLNERAA